MPSCEFKLRLRGSICERGQKKLQSRGQVYLQKECKMSICSLDVTFGQSPGRTSDRSEATKSALEEKTDAASQLILKHQGGLASVSRTADELVSALSANQLIPSDFTAHSWKDSGRAYYIDPFYDDSLKLGMANLYGYRFRDGPLTHIPNSVMNLDLDLRESSRGSSILSRPILTIWGDLRSTIPGALARSKFQVADRVGYKRDSALVDVSEFQSDDPNNN